MFFITKRVWKICFFINQKRIRTGEYIGIRDNICEINILETKLKYYKNN